MTFLVQLLIAVVLSVAAYMLAPKPKQSTNSMAKDLESPTVEAGRPIPVVFGTLTVKSPNVLWYGQKLIREYKVKA